MIDNKNKLFAITIILVISSVIIISNVPNSYAHASVTKSDPAALSSLSTSPSKVDVYFIDPIDIKYRQVKLLDSD